MKLSALLTSAVLIVLITTGLISCSNAQETSGGVTSFNQTMPDNSYTFRDNGVKWRVDFEEEGISALYKNGERIPDNEISSYESMIYNNINKLRKNLSKTESDVYVLKFDAEKLKENVKKVKRNLRKSLPDKIKIEIDKEEFEKGMDALKESLESIKSQKFEFHFDNESFSEEMKKLKENLQHNLEKIDTDKIKIEIRKDMDDLEKEIEKIKIHIDDIDIDLSGLDDEMETLSLEMDNLDKFISVIKSELKKDGYIESEDEKLELNMHDDSITINGKEISREHQSKYKDLYKKHFGDEKKMKFKIIKK